MSRRDEATLLREALIQAVSSRSIDNVCFVLEKIDSITQEIYDSCIKGAQVAIEKGCVSILEEILACKVFKGRYKQQLTEELPDLIYLAVASKDDSAMLLQALLSSVFGNIGTRKKEKALNSLNSDGFSSLHQAAMDGDVMCGEKLLAFGADATCCSRDGNSALSLSIAYNRPYFSEFILPHSDVNTRDDDDDTPLMFASWRRQSSLTALLIQKGADCNVKNRHGSTALWNAVYRGSVDCTRLLLQNNSAMDVCCEGTRLFLSNQEDRPCSAVQKIYPGCSRSLMWVAVDRAKSENSTKNSRAIIAMLLAAGYDSSRDLWIRSIDSNLSITITPQTLANADRLKLRIPTSPESLLTTNKALVRSLKFFHSRPPRLQDLCRNRIRAYHQDDMLSAKLSFTEWTRSLGLGKYMVTFLTLQYI